VRIAAAARHQSRVNSLRVMGYGLEPHYDIWGLKADVREHYFLRSLFLRSKSALTPV